MLVNRTRPDYAFGAIRSLIGIGGRIVEEVNDLVAKAEDYFGRRVTAGGLAIISLGMIAAAMRSIWSNILLPLSSSIAGVNISWSLFFAFIQVVGCVLLATYAIIGHRYNKRLVGDLDQSRKLIDSAQIVLEEANRDSQALYCERERLSAQLEASVSLYQAVMDKNAAAQLALENVVSTLRASGPTGQDQADAIRSLLNTEPETPP